MTNQQSQNKPNHLLKNTKGKTNSRFSNSKNKSPRTMAQYASNAGRKQLSTENCESEIKTFAHKQKLREVTTSDSKERNF